MMPRKAIFLFCGDLAKDPVAAHVLQESKRLFPLVESGLSVDGHPVLVWEREGGDAFYYAATDEVVSHDYGHYLPVLNTQFAGFATAGLVNWHAGGNAPPAVLCAHTTGDVPSGNFGQACPAALLAVLLAMDRNRRALGLDRFRTSLEATHWSGVQYGQSPQLLLNYPVPLIDIEIGSSPASYADPGAVEAVARALPCIFEDPGPFESLLCVGGMHFEPAFSDPVLNSSEPRLAASHVLPNQWLDAYAVEGTQERLEQCVRSISGGIDAIVFHDNLKGPQKAHLRLLGETLGVPVVKHQRLRQPGSIEWRSRGAEQQ